MSLTSNKLKRRRYFEKCLFIVDLNRQLVKKFLSANNSDICTDWLHVWLECNVFELQVGVSS
jgi:hypothetical protein